MSTIVCGKRIYLEEYSLNPVSKRTRYVSSTPPVRFSTPPSIPRFSLLDTLTEVFPLMDKQLLDKALEECGDDIDSAIKRLNELSLGSSECSISNHVMAQVEQCSLATEGKTSAHTVLPADGTQWVELFVKEMMTATNVDDALARAGRVLQALEKSIRAADNASADAADNYQKENIMLKEQIEGLMRENSIFKRAVQIQHERSKEFDEKNQEVEQLKHLLSQYQEQLRGLEVTNYALSMHLKQAQQSSSLPARFHPDIF